jgi:hypothetical protein
MKRLAEPVPRRAGLTLGEFRAEYLLPERPVILTDQVTRWSAFQNWSVDYLTRHYGQRPVRSFTHPTGLYTALKRTPVRTSFGAFLEQCDPQRVLVIEAMQYCPYLLHEFDVPSVVDPSWIRDDATLWFQPEGTRTGLHWDSFNSMLGVVRGSKRVLLFTPDHFDRLYPCDVQGIEDVARGSWSRMDVFAPDFKLFPRAREAAFQEVEVRAGELLLIPRSWWHAVSNFGSPAMAISFFVVGQGKEQPIFYEDRTLIAGLALRAGLRESGHHIMGAD